MKVFFASRIGRLGLIFCLLLTFSALAAAQAGAQDQRSKAFQLMKEQKYTEALPLLENLATAVPSDPDVQFYLGFALLGQAKHTDDPTAAKALRARARAAFVKAKELGNGQPMLQGLIDGIPPDGGTDPGFSNNSQANKLMEEGERAFSSGRLDDALAAYQKALNLDPRLYHAALFSGDVYTQKGKYADAEVWYQKAIAIDPFIETAYRYSATPLMKQNKTDKARERYVEAFIVDPYNRLAVSGIVQWAQATGAQLGHPKIDVPEFKTGPDGKSITTINVNPAADDGSIGWMSYVNARDEWRKDKFAKAHPGEKNYRHSLQEEADALRSVVTTAKALKPKSLNEQIKFLAKLDEEGLLESYVLLARADQGIAGDYRDYLKANREKLRLYVNRYVIVTK